MIYPWQPVSSAGDDVEGLQADVMRFIAIFGLCLAAIFSLVREAEHEYAAAKPQEPVFADTGEPIINDNVFTEHNREPINDESQRNAHDESHPHSAIDSVDGGSRRG